MTPVPARQHHNLTLGVLVVSALAFALTQTMVVPALPAIQTQLGASPTEVTWVLTVFLLTMPTMRFAELAQTSADVAATAARLEKVSGRTRSISSSSQPSGDTGGARGTSRISLSALATP